MIICYGIHIDTKDQSAYVGEFPDVHVKVLKVASEKNTALIGINKRNRDFHDLYRLDSDGESA